MLVHPHYFNWTPTNALIIRMGATDKSSSIATSEYDVYNRSHERLRSYEERVNSMLKTSVRNQAFAEFDTSILRCMQPANKTPQQYADDVVA